MEFNTEHSATPSSLSSPGLETPLASTTSSRSSSTSSKRPVDFSFLQHLFSTSSSTDANNTSLWYIITTAVLLSFHRERLVSELWIYLTTQIHEQEEQVAAARQLREACLKSSTLVGFPRAINALFSLKAAIDEHCPQLSAILAADASLRSPISPSAKYDRGMAFFEQIYQKHTARVISAMDSTSGGDLTHFAINCIYGELLSEHRIIGGLETGLLEFVCCLADGCGPQAKGHFFGSINLGATQDTLQATVLLAQEIAKQLGVRCPWHDDAEEFAFLGRVMRTS